MLQIEPRWSAFLKFFGVHGKEKTSLDFIEDILSKQYRDFESGELLEGLPKECLEV